MSFRTTKEWLAGVDADRAELSKRRQFAADVCQLVTLVQREEISHTDFVNKMTDLADIACGDAHHPTSTEEP